MARLIVRELSDEVEERLKARAKRHGRSLEAEAREILEEAATKEPSPRRRKGDKGFGTLMHERFKKTGMTEEEWKLFRQGIDECRSSGRVGIRDAKE